MSTTATTIATETSTPPAIPAAVHSASEVGSAVGAGSSSTGGVVAVPHPKGATDEQVTWGSHRIAASALRIGIVVVPALVATCAVWWIGGRLTRPTGSAAALWFVGLLAVGAGAYVVVERLTRRLLPLAALLRLSLVLPDQTPSRYRIALCSGTTRHLKRVVADAEHGHFGDTPAEAAERVLVLVAALNRHDRLTRGHSERVRAYTEVIGEELGLSGSELSMLRWAALLHDVGKIAVPGEILNKRDRLTDEEFEIIKTHPAVGAEMVAPLRSWLGDAVDAVGQHHERWDGRGYPCGLAGEDISLAGRIVAVADTFDVITSSRSYKKAMTPTAARVEIARCAGTQFDPQVTRALLTVSIGRLWVAGGALTWGTSLPVLSQLSTGGGLLPAVGNAVAGAVAAVAIVVGGAPVVGAQLAPRDIAAVTAPAGRVDRGLDETSSGRSAAGRADRSGATPGAGSVGTSGGPDASPTDATVPGLGEPTAATGNPTTAPGGPAAAPFTTSGDGEPSAGAGPSRRPGDVVAGTVDGAAAGLTGTLNGAGGAVTGVVNGAGGDVSGAVNRGVGGVTGVVNRAAGGATGVTVPQVTVPAVTVPPVTLPTVTVPPAVTGILNGLLPRR